ncbi:MULTISPECIES: PadR family transcriptional regulator [Paenibacillus]|uniref:PadR family transcriptional regulator n=1 Tax=Paenibacillus TaxID=44249 RepID=UPI002FE1B8B9
MDIEVLILAQLMQGPKHGYEIKKNIVVVLNSQRMINNNSLYPKLKRFEERGMVSKTMEEQDKRPNRHVYAITESGRRFFLDTLHRFSPELIESDEEWGLRLAYYHFLDKPARMRLLVFRRQALAEKRLRLEKLGQGDLPLFSRELSLYLQDMMMKEEEIIIRLQAELDQL